MKENKLNSILNNRQTEFRRHDHILPKLSNWEEEESQVSS